MHNSGGEYQEGGVEVREKKGNIERRKGGKREAISREKKREVEEKRRNEDKRQKSKIKTWLKIRTKPSKNDDTVGGVGKKNELKMKPKREMTMIFLILKAGKRSW